MYQFELFDLVLLLKLDKRFPVEQFEATVSQSTVPSPPLRKTGFAVLPFAVLQRQLAGALEENRHPGCLVSGPSLAYVRPWPARRASGYRERERERCIYTYISLSIYIYIYTHTRHTISIPKYKYIYNHT